MIINLQVAIGNRVVTETLTTTEDFRGDFRKAITEMAAHVELSTFGPQLHEGSNFDEQLRGRGH